VRPWVNRPADTSTILWATSQLDTRSTRHNAAIHDGQLVTPFLAIFGCDKLTVCRVDHIPYYDTEVPDCPTAPSVGQVVSSQSVEYLISLPRVQDMPNFSCTKNVDGEVKCK